ncbi:acetyl-CoA hydrolase/transferase C-terminal domain-containing protein [Peptoniphilus raoultii]|uniref:acetyl-CoA hydrolase/transferase C-terminal domain-containing protein n=1 Tax=Peptoniphilus raoultii TaxID=1776387 RepID=UPI0008D92E71|nr:acetyl-CoA hydrolase/transferase C-terminal domain-containing protein [Peptoniphilus raoultii]
MDYKKIFNEKLISPKQAAGLVKDGMKIDYGWAAGMCQTFDKALAKDLDRLNEIQVSCGVILWKPAIFDADLDGKKIIWNSYHSGGPDRKRINAGEGGFYVPLRYSEVPRWIRENIDIDIAVVVATPMNKHGYFNFGISASHQMAVIEKAKKVIIEVNENVPYCQGGMEHEISVNDVDYIIESGNPPLVEIPEGAFTDVDRKVANLIVEEIPNGATLQLGIGGMPNAVGSLIAESDLKDLGVHTEMYVDGFVDMTLKGKVTGAKKNIDRFRQVYAFAAGSKKLYDFLDNNSEAMAAPVDYTNSAATCAQIDNFISINNAVNIDLYGQVSSESSGLKHISGAGGQFDFTLGAYLSKGGKAFICLSSQFANKKTNKNESRIVPQFDYGTAITIPRPCTHYLVTEYGKFNCKGRSTWERAEGIINLAAPEFRDDLIKEAEKLNIWRHSNKR